MGEKIDYLFLHNRSKFIDTLKSFASSLYSFFEKDLKSNCKVVLYYKSSNNPLESHSNLENMLEVAKYELSKNNKYSSAICTIVEKRMKNDKGFYCYLKKTLRHTNNFIEERFKKTVKMFVENTRNPDFVDSKSNWRLLEEVLVKRGFRVVESNSGYYPIRKK